MRSLLVLVAVFASSLAVAETPPKKTKPTPKVKGEDTAKAEDKPEAPPEEAAAPAEEPQLPPHIEGPKLVEIATGLELALPAGMIMFEKAVAQDLLKQGGDSYEDVVGIVLRKGATWSVIITSEDSGYVSDDDAGQLDADTLLGQIKVGTAEQKKKSGALGVPELTIEDWTAKPAYDRTKHHLVWGLAAHDTNSKIINFNTRVLGRHGVVSVNLIDAPENMEAAIPEGLAVLEATRFKDGYRYSDFREGDRESGMSLTGLIVGGAGVAVAKKAGLLAAFALFMKKGWILVVAAFAGIAKLFRRKREDVTLKPTDSSNEGPR
ncbi:MAG: DUF2167 domain-containing protein [Kofleriaceae bacterium]|nr:DUF2167 domain-containing protein [Kofleriaceae bacterium]